MQKFMKTKYLLSSLLLSLLLCGCGGGNSPSENITSSEDISSENVVSSENDPISEIVSSEEIISSEEDIVSELVSSDNLLSTEEVSSEKDIVSSEAISSSDKLDDETLFSVIENAVAKKEKVSSGTLAYNDGNVDKNLTYKFGNDKYGDFTVYEYDGYNEIYGYDSLSNVYGLVETNSSYSLLSSYVVDNIAGPSVNPFAYKENHYGAEGIMTSMLTYAKENKNMDFVNKSTSSNYEFSVGRVVSNGFVSSLYMSDVTFEIEDECFKSVNITIKKYNDIVADFEYAGVYYINDGAKVNRTYQITYAQTFGERLSENSFDIEDFYFDEFTLVNENNEVIDSNLVTTVGVDTSLSINTFSPNSANKDIDQLKVVSLSEELEFTYNYSDGKIDFLFKTIGSFKIQIKSRNYTVELDLTVKNVVPEEVNITYYVEKNNDYNSTMVGKDKDSFDIYRNSTIYLQGSFSPYNADQGYEVEMLSETKDTLTFEKTTITLSDVLNNEKQVYKIKSTEVTSFDVKISSVEHPSVSRTITINVVEEPALSDLIAKRYVFLEKGVITKDVIFTPNEEDNTTGKVKVDDLYGANSTYTYKYNSETRNFNINGSGVSLYFDDTFTLIFQSNNSAYSLVEFTPVNMLRNCEWTGVLPIKGDSSKRIAITITFDKVEQKGSITVSRIENYVSTYSESYDFTYEATKNEDGGYVLTIDEDCINAMLESEHISSFDNTFEVNDRFSTVSVSGTIDDLDVQINCTRAY